MKKRIASVVLAASLALPIAGSALPTAAAGETEPTQVDIVAMDYHYMLGDGSDFPKEFVAGDYKFTFRNDGEKRHMVSMVKMLHGKTLKQLLKMSGKKVQKHIREVGFSFAKPGKEGKEFFGTLKEGGRYVMVCFEQNSKKAKPHVMAPKNMFHRFNVVAPEVTE